jgi:FolB domain-containing protein
MSHIRIVDLEVFYNVGVSDEERAKPQRLLLTVDMEFDFSSAALNDRITKTIDYGAVAQHLLTFGDGRNWKLIEKLSNDIADEILAEFHPEVVNIEVKKFPIPQAAHVAVRLTKHRSARGAPKGAAWGMP